MWCGGLTAGIQTGTWPWEILSEAYSEKWRILW